nr:hypothetical protein [Tanacetum cinerariifolium]
MANLEFCEKHNMVAFLKKPTGSEVDGKEFTIAKASIRRHLQFEDADDEAVYEEWDDSVERATTTAASFNAAQDNGNILKTQSVVMPNVPLPQGIDKVLALKTDLRQTKKVYGTAYTKLIIKVKKLEKTVKSNQAKRRTKIVVSDDEEDSEDSSKQGRMIEEIDQDTRITLVTPIKPKILYLIHLLMANLEFCEKYNMVAFLKKPTGSEVDGKEFTNAEASVRRHLQFEDADDEAVYEEWDDSVERATTTAASFNAAQDSSNILKTQSVVMPNVPLPQGIDKVLALKTDLRQTKKVYGTAYTKLIMKVNKLEKTVKSNQARRRTKIVVSDDEEDSEDSSKQGRMIEEIDQDTRITLVTPIKVNTYTRRRRAVSTGSEGVSTAIKIFSTAKESVSTAGESMPMSLDEELAQKLYEEEQARFNAEKEAKFKAEQEELL